MVSRKWLTTCLRVFLWTIGVGLAAAGSFAAIAGIVALVRGGPILEGENAYLTVICAFIAWLFVTVFHFGRETIFLPFHQPGVFLANACRVLQEMGYEVSGQSADALATRRGLQFFLFCRGIQIHCADKQARITGPKIWVDSLRRRLRVQNFLGGTQQALSDVQPRSGGLLLKRVQVRMRVSPEKLEKVGRYVVQALAQEAEVVCEISLLAQSETGIRESTVEQEVRAWLGDQGITAEIHKDLAMMSEPPSAIFSPSGIRRKVPVM